VIHMTSELRALLESQRAITDAYQKEREKIRPWVFNRHGQQIQDFRHAWQSACRLAGCPGRIPHDLRRTAVRNFVRAGVSEHVAMKLSGGKTASVFRRCEIVSDSDLVDAAEKLQAATANARAADPRLRLGVAVMTHGFRRSADPLGSCPAVGCMLATRLRFSAALR
jgi:hypothetical protein